MRYAGNKAANISDEAHDVHSHTCSPSFHKKNNERMNNANCLEPVFGNKDGFAMEFIRQVSSRARCVDRDSRYLHYHRHHRLPVHCFEIEIVSLC